MDAMERKQGMEALAARTPVVYLATLDRDGAPRIKVVSVNRREGIATFWFVTQTERRTTAEIQMDNRASIYFADNETYETLLLTGHARISREPALLQAMWQEGMRSMFPGGYQDPSFCAIAFVAQGGKYYRWPYTGEFTLAEEEPLWLNWINHESSDQ